MSEVFFLYKGEIHRWAEVVGRSCENAKDSFIWEVFLLVYNID